MPEGTSVGGYLVGAGEPKVIVVHEIFGITAHMREVAERLAAEGFTALVVDLFDGRTTDDLAEGIALGRSLDWPAAVQRIRAAAERLGGGAPVGVVGFCLGGGLALAAAAAGELGPCVCFYGIPGPDKADLTRIRGPVQAHFGTRDIYYPNEQVDALERLLAGAGVRAELHRYDAEHGFIREAPASDAARLAWARTLAFLRAELAGARGASGLNRSAAP